MGKKQVLGQQHNKDDVGDCGKQTQVLFHQTEGWRKATYKMWEWVNVMGKRVMLAVTDVEVEEVVWLVMAEEADPFKYHTILKWIAATFNFN